MASSSPRHHLARPARVGISTFSRAWPGAVPGTKTQESTCIASLAIASVSPTDGEPSVHVGHHLRAEARAAQGPRGPSAKPRPAAPSAGDARGVGALSMRSVRNSWSTKSSTPPRRSGRSERTPGSPCTSLLLRLVAHVRVAVASRVQAKNQTSRSGRKLAGDFLSCSVTRSLISSVAYASVAREATTASPPLCAAPRHGRNKKGRDIITSIVCELASFPARVSSSIKRACALVSLVCSQTPHQQRN